MDNVRLNKFLELYSAFDGSLSVSITKKLRRETTKKGLKIDGVFLLEMYNNNVELTKILKLKVYLIPLKIEFVEYEFCEVDADFDTIVNDIKDLIINKL